MKKGANTDVLFTICTLSGQAMRFPVLFFVLFILPSFLWPATPRAQELAAWVVRFDIDTPTKVKAVCGQATGHGFSRLLVQVRGRADAYYQSDLVPRAENLEPGFDPLASVLAQCGDVEIDAWLNVYYLWTGTTPPRDAGHPALDKSWLIRDQTGRRVDGYSDLELGQRWLEGLYADPASERYRRVFTAAVVELVERYDLHGIHLDFARYPGPYFGAGGRLARQFAQRYGLAVNDLPEQLSRQDFAAWLNGSLASDQRRLITARLIWDYQRAAEVSKLVAMVRAGLVRVRPGLRLSVSVFPDPVDAFLAKGQDWPGWLAAGMVDELFLMNYFGDAIRVQALYDEAIGVAGNRAKVWLGLGSYIKSPADIAAEIALCAGGQQAACFFSLGHILRQGKAVRPYVEAVRRHAGAGSGAGQPASLLAGRLAEVKTCLAVSGWPDCGEEGEGILAAGDHGQDQVRGGPWLELRGIFRYVDPYDGLAKVEEQLHIARQSRELLLAGQPFAEVSRLFSQAGSRGQGGFLPRRSVRQDRWVDRLLAGLEPGQISPVIAVENGYWVYQMVRKGNRPDVRRQ